MFLRHRRIQRNSYDRQEKILQILPSQIIKPSNQIANKKKDPNQTKICQIQIPYGHL